jgi:hypothetical protein
MIFQKECFGLQNLILLYLKLGAKRRNKIMFKVGDRIRIKKGTFPDHPNWDNQTGVVARVRHPKEGFDYNVKMDNPVIVNVSDEALLNKNEIELVKPSETTKYACDCCNLEEVSFTNNGGPALFEVAVCGSCGQIQENMWERVAEQINNLTKELRLLGQGH